MRDLLRACLIVDGCEDVDEETCREAWQLLIDTGVAWQLQGRIGRMADDLIASGFCEAPCALAA